MAGQAPFNQSFPKKINRMAIFGATGDVTGRLVFPALGQLIYRKLLPSDFSIIAMGRQNWSTKRFHQHVKGKLGNHAPDLEINVVRSLLNRMTYTRVQEVGNSQQVKKALGPSKAPMIFYLGLPPSTFQNLLQSFCKIGLSPHSRIIFEKPFGEDLNSAQKINKYVHNVLAENNVYRIDHFLGKQTVKNILGLRFGNRIFEPIWNHHHIERVDILWDETLGLEGRAGYYDSSGALKDMIQNHLLQLLCLVGMEPPISMCDRDFRDRKVDLLRSVRRLSQLEVKRYTTRARYRSGRVKGKSIPSYTEEDGVDPKRKTETFAKVTLWVENWRWAGIPFTLRTGKALAQDKNEIVIHFKTVPHVVFNNSEERTCNILRLSLKPDQVELCINLNGPDDPLNLEPFHLEAQLAPQVIPAYGHLILDVIEGDSTLFIRSDEAEESWRIVEPIIKFWKQGQVPLQTYKAGTDGPNAHLRRI